MILLKERIHYLKLFDFYSDLLTQTQKQAIWLHLNEDLSFKEVAEILAVSRSAVFDSVKKSIKLLEKYETILKLNHKNNFLQKLCNDLSEIKDQKIDEIVDKIRSI